MFATTRPGLDPGPRVTVAPVRFAARGPGSGPGRGCVCDLRRMEEAKRLYLKEKG